MRKKYKLKRYGYVVFNDEQGRFIARAGVTNNSKSHRLGVEKSFVGTLWSGLHQSMYGRSVNVITTERKLDRSKQLDVRGYGTMHPAKSKLSPLAVK